MKAPETSRLVQNVPETILCCRPRYMNNLTLHILSQRYSQPSLFWGGKMIPNNFGRDKFLANPILSNLYTLAVVTTRVQKFCSTNVHWTLPPFFHPEIWTSRPPLSAFEEEKMPQRADLPKIWVRNELKFLGIDLIVMLHLRSPDILIEEVQGAFFKLNIQYFFT